MDNSLHFVRPHLAVTVVVRVEGVSFDMVTVPHLHARGRGDRPEILTSDPAPVTGTRVKTYDLGPLPSPHLRLNPSRTVRPVRVTNSVSLYEHHWLAATIGVDLSGEWLTSDLNELVNGLVSDQVPIWYGRAARGSISSLVADAVSTVLSLQGRPAELADLMLNDRYSCVAPEEITPPVDAPLEHLPEWMQRQLFAGILRRPTTFDEFDMPKALATQENASVYSSDLIYVSRHNLLAFVPEGRGHLGASFYQDAYERRRVYLGVLRELDRKSSLALASLGEFEVGASLLRKLTLENGNRVLEFTRWNDVFKPASSAIAGRARRFDRAVDDVLEIGSIESQLREKLMTVDSVLAARYSVTTQGILQWIAIMIALASTIATILTLVGK